MFYTRRPQVQCVYKIDMAIFNLIRYDINSLNIKISSMLKRKKVHHIVQNERTCNLQFSIQLSDKVASGKANIFS